MPEEQTNELIHFHWQVPEYEIHNRGKVWYFVAGFVTVILFLYAIFSTNYLFAIIILIFAIILAVSSLKQPEIIDVKITDQGVQVGSKFMPYHELDHFYIVYQPPEVKNLYLESSGGFKNRSIVFLDGQDPTQIKEILAQYLPEDIDRIDEPLIEFLSRKFKI